MNPSPILKRFLLTRRGIQLSEVHGELIVFEKASVNSMIRLVSMNVINDDAIEMSIFGFCH